jgi:hypothetical protein
MSNKPTDAIGSEHGHGTLPRTLHIVVKTVVVLNKEFCIPKKENNGAFPKTDVFAKLDPKAAGSVPHRGQTNTGACECFSHTYS